MMRLLISILFCLGTLFHAADLHAQDESSVEGIDSTSPSVERDTEHRPPPRMGGGGRRPGPPMRRMDNPTEADIDSFILVAGELKPEWKGSLETMRAGDPERFQETLRSLGRRIWYLVELKAQNPSLFRLRIEEIRNDEQLWTLAKAHRESLNEDDGATSEQILARLKDLALIQVDLKLRVRAEELAAMASALERLRTEVLMDLEQRQVRADQMVERLLSGKMPSPGHHRKQKSRKFREPSIDGSPPNSPLPSNEP
jgi:hypothetical protein